MQTYTNTTPFDQKGFTLVELAIVMIIIGLLIGGVLKGQELIANARVSSSLALITEIDAAASTFKGSYDEIPGDMLDPNLKIPNCLGVCDQDGDADGTIDMLPGALVANLANEGATYWAQLSSADIMGGVQPNAGGVVAGESHPLFPAGGALRIGQHPGGAAATGATSTGGINTRLGSYVNTTSDLGVAATLDNATAALTTAFAARIDAKMDDGKPNTGSVIGVGLNDGSPTACATANDNTGIYLTSVSSVNCNLYIRVQD